MRASWPKQIWIGHRELWDASTVAGSFQVMYIEYIILEYTQQKNNRCQCSTVITAYLRAMSLKTSPKPPTDLRQSSPWQTSARARPAAEDKGHWPIPKCWKMDPEWVDVFPIENGDIPAIPMLVYHSLPILKTPSLMHASAKRWLEHYPIGKVIFQGRTVKLQEGI